MVSERNTEQANIYKSSIMYVLIVKGKGKGHFYLTSVVPSVPMRLLSMEADGAPSTPPATVSAPFYGYSKL